MKKVSNNTSLGKLTQLLNLVILVFVILSVVFLLKFDKVNIVKVDYEPGYLAAKEKMHEVVHPMKKNQAEVDYYAYKLDTLQQHQATADKKTAKALQEDIDRTKKTLAVKEEILAQTKADSVAQQELLAPIEGEYNAMVEQTDSAKSLLNIFLMVAIILFVVKIVLWAIWNYKNSKNLRSICSWMEKAAAPVWAFFGWIIPLYNLIKPYTFFQELFDETEYALKDKSILAKENAKADTDFTLGFWWGMFLLTVCLMSVFLFGTFFGDGAAFYKLNHTWVAIVAIVFWVIYILVEINIIRKYNKMNQMLVDNESKF